MALFGKKTKTPESAGAPVAAPDAPQNADFAADVFGADETTEVPVDKKGRKAKAPKAPKTSKSRGVKSGTVVGLNIGNNLIKAVEVSSRNGELTVIGVGVMVTPPECYSNGNILSVSALSGALKSLWKQSGFKSKDAILSVAGTGSLVVRVIEVPKMTDSELSDNMKVDADRYIPFPPSEVIMDFKALRDLPSDPDAPNMEVLLAAAQREVIDLHVKVVQNAKLNPKAIDVEPVATARAVGLKRVNAGFDPDYDEVTALLNIGATGTEISVLRGDVIVFTRTLPNGGNSLTNAIAEAFGTSFGDAESQKKRLANALPPAGYATAGNEFSDFNQGFGGDIAAFSDDVFGGTSEGNSSPFDDFGATASSSGPTSSDPFDMDFFNQGPKQNEPGTGHSQKEDEEAANKPPNFNFSFDEDLSNMPAQVAPDAPTNAPTLSGDVVAPSPINFDFDKNIPTQESTPPASASAPPTTPIASAFDFSDFDLPSIAEPETGSIPATPTSQTATDPIPATESVKPTPDAFTFGFSEAAAIPSVGQTTVSQAPISDEPQAPTLEPESAAILAREDASSASPSFNFGFAGVPETPSASASEAAPVNFSFDSTPKASSTEKPISMENAPTQPNEGASLDFDTMFAQANDATPQNSTPGADPTGFETSPFDVSVEGTAPNTGSRTAGLDLDDIQLGGNTGGFDLGGANFGDDAGFGDEAAMNFGVGLGEAVDADAAALYSAISPALEELGAEVRRSLEYHLGRYPDTMFSKIYLVGGGANLQNLDQFFTENLGVPTEIVNPLRFVEVSIPKKGEEEIDALVTQIGTSCATALGLAIRDFVA